MNNKGIILLSGGLDSLVSLGLEIEKQNIKLALTFDYGQKSARKEIEAARKIADYYKIEHKVIRLDWLKEITQTALVADKEIPTGETNTNSIESAKAVWVPNRNGLFLNIAGSFADAKGYNSIIIGANKEESKTFSDNSPNFIKAINNEFKYSTQNHPKVIAPLINCDKNDIVMLALKNNIPLELVMSCYQSTEGHCGECESCLRLKKALSANNDKKFIKVLFK